MNRRELLKWFSFAPAAVVALKLPKVEAEEMEPAPAKEKVAGLPDGVTWVNRFDLQKYVRLEAFQNVAREDRYTYDQIYDAMKYDKGPAAKHREELWKLEDAKRETLEISAGEGS